MTIIALIICLTQREIRRWDYIGVILSGLLADTVICTVIVLLWQVL
jgi:hypothetical protein